MDSVANTKLSLPPPAPLPWSFNDGFIRQVGAGVKRGWVGRLSRETEVMQEFVESAPSCKRRRIAGLFQDPSVRSAQNVSTLRKQSTNQNKTMSAGSKRTMSAGPKNKKMSAGPKNKTMSAGPKNKTMSAAK